LNYKLDVNKWFIYWLVIKLPSIYYLLFARYSCDGLFITFKARNNDNTTQLYHFVLQSSILWDSIDHIVNNFCDDLFSCKAKANFLLSHQCMLYFIISLSYVYISMVWVTSLISLFYHIKNYIDAIHVVSYYSHESQKYKITISANLADFEPTYFS